MFGNPETSSPGFPTAVLEEDVVDVTILACRPADLSDVPDAVSQRWTPLQNGWVRDHCECCQREVHVGREQVTKYVQHQDPAPLIMCLLCAALMMIQNDVDTSGVNIHTLEAN
jgi:hypothetical protein